MPGPDPSAAQALASLRQQLEEQRWRPLRQPVGVREAHDGWWWKLALALLPAALFLAMLWVAAEPDALPPRAAVERIEVVFIPRSATPRPPPPPTAPALRSRPSLLAPPVPELPDTSALPSPVTDGTETVSDLPPPTAGDLLRQLNSTAARRYDLDGEGIPRHGRPRLPGRAEAFVEGIHVRGRPSPQQRVQFVLGLVGLGQPDPCPDVRRHVRDAIAAEQRGQGVDGELDDWLTRAERCRR